MKIGLSLAGGGVKGAAHIGAIRALEENNIQISAVAGTSIGSVVAALFAMEYTTEEMLKLFKYFSKSMLKTDPKYLMSNIRNTKSLFGSGVISGQSIEDAAQECARLKELTYIQDLKIPIAMPAVDIKTGKEYVFTNYEVSQQEKGTKTDKYLTNIEIGKAVRASCSYPAIFSPVEYKQYRFVDGGVLDNVPTEEAKRLGVDKVITIKFPPKDVENPKNALDVFMRSMDIVFNENDSKKSKNSDYVIDIDVTSSGSFDIKKIDYCYEAGYKTTIEQMIKIKKALEGETNN